MHSEALLDIYLVYTVISGTRQSNAVYDLDVLQPLTTASQFCELGALE